MVDVDGMHAGDEILARTMKELLDDVEKGHRVSAAESATTTRTGLRGRSENSSPLTPRSVSAALESASETSCVRRSASSFEGRAADLRAARVA